MYSNNLQHNYFFPIFRKAIKIIFIISSVIFLVFQLVRIGNMKHYEYMHKCSSFCTVSTNDLTNSRVNTALHIEPLL